MSHSREHTLSAVTLWGAVANAALAVAKLFAGIIGRSAAMTADAVHSFSDLISDVVVLAMLRISSKGKDQGHDYGHGKYETLATVAVSLLLLVVGGKMMASGVEKIHAVLSGESVPAPGRLALAAALVSIAVKEILYHWTARTGRKFNSQALIANAWHHRSDALSSIGSALGIGGAILLGGKWTVLDPVVGCVISIVIIYIAVKMALPALNELTEASLPEDVEAEISQTIGSISGIDDVHELKTRRNGPSIIIDAHVVVDPHMSVAQAHELTTAAENALRSKYGAGTQISLHVEPSPEAE